MHFVELTCLDDTKVWVNMSKVVEMDRNTVDVTSIYIVNVQPFKVKETIQYILSCLPA